jgi:2-oxoglutarate ferredoxin oxidoreductase subunit beta
MTSGTSLITDAQNTWCPGCGNFSIQHTLKTVIAELIESGTPPENIVLVTGIGCHAKMADYLNISSFYTIHGRTAPVATGIKIANPDLTVLCCAGDGDAYAEGLDHLIFAAKRNIGITMIIYNNRVYGLTTGQYTPTSPLGFRGKSTPAGTMEYPLNPLEMMLGSGAGFVARSYTRKQDHLKEILRAGIRHRGFAFIDLLQICATFFNMTDYYADRVYELPPEYDPGSFEAACAKAREWDYNTDARIALGILYRRVFPTFEERIGRWSAEPVDRDAKIARVLKGRT